MSKISYCSLEEAWGTTYPVIDNIKTDKEKNKYDYLTLNSDIQRTEVITNMNKVERNDKKENNINLEHEKYRFNPINKVSNNNYDDSYTPFKESIEKKYLKDKLNYLENQIRKYDYIIENNEKINNYENFSNKSNDENDKNQSNNQNQSNDIIDLILLIIIGLIIIFIMNSIFNIGKSIGAKNKNI
jgi:hypothetical protein